MSKDGYLSAKRALDVVAGASALVVTSPLLVALAVAIKLHDFGPVLFAQERAGKDGRVFRLLKLRTMSLGDSSGEELDTSTWLDGVPDDFVFKTSQSSTHRITGVGRWLRRTSLDELPQLINVVAGDMSLVGPRPEILPIVERYTADQARRLTMKPGITGWAQVTGRDRLDHGHKMAADRYYVEHASMLLDLRILVRTLWVALRGREAY